MSVSDNLKDFYVRWNIKPNTSIDKKFEEFKCRTLNSIQKIFSVSYEFEEKEFHHEFFTIAGINIVLYDLGKSNVLHVLSSETNYVEYIKYLEMLSWMKRMPPEAKELLFKLFKSDIDNSLIDLNIKQIEDRYIFYPRGAKLLDEKLVNDVLDWLKEYESSYIHLYHALQNYDPKKKDTYRIVLDDMRLSLELLVKLLLKNDKSLENQISLLGNYLKEKSISNEARNMFHKLLEYYTTYNDNHVKHISEKGNTNVLDPISPFEVEFIIYLTGSFMRLLLSVEQA